MKKHLGEEQLPKSTFEKNVKIVSVEISTILVHMFLVIFMLVGTVFSFTDIYTILKTTGWSRQLLSNQEFLIMLSMFVLSLACVYGIFETFKTNIYVLKLEEREFIYKFISEMTIPYDAIQKLQFISSANTWKRDFQILRILLDDGRVIKLRLDHLYVYKAAEIIRPRDKRYLIYLEMRI